MQDASWTYITIDEVYVTPILSWNIICLIVPLVRHVMKASFVYGMVVPVHWWNLVLEFRLTSWRQYKKEKIHIVTGFNPSPQRIRKSRKFIHSSSEITSTKLTFPIYFTWIGRNLLPLAALHLFQIRNYRRNMLLSLPIALSLAKEEYWGILNHGVICKEEMVQIIWELLFCSSFCRLQ